MISFLHAGYSLALATFASATLAATQPTWQINSDRSTITFTGTQNNAPVSGKFMHFTANVHFSPEQLKDSNATITVDMNSVSTSYPLIAETLKTEDWFDVKKYPAAVFKSTSLKKTGKDTYTATGTITLRDKTQPMTIQFTLEQSQNQAKATGSTTLKRSAFEIGGGEWAKSGDVKDEVSIHFSVSATKK